MAGTDVAAAWFFRAGDRGAPNAAAALGTPIVTDAATLRVRPGRYTVVKIALIWNDPVN